MAWVKLDDGFADHPKVLAAGPLASWLFVCGLNYCGRLLTDGFIPEGQVRKLADLDGAPQLAERLVAANLWERAEGGYQVHDYLDYQPSRAQVLADRAKTKERVSAWRERNAVSNGVTNGVGNGVSNAPPVPSRPVPVGDPVPVPSDVEGSHDAPGADAPPKPKRPQQVPENWEPSADDRAWAEREGFSGAELERQLPMFRDHYRGQGKPMKDWAATWRNWMRRSRDDPRFAPRPRASPNGHVSGGSFSEAVRRHETPSPPEPAGSIDALWRPR